MLIHLMMPMRLVVCNLKFKMINAVKNSMADQTIYINIQKYDRNTSIYTTYLCLAEWPGGTSFPSSSRNLSGLHSNGSG